MVKIVINNQEINVQPGISILQACEILNIEIPHFCYHPKLPIAGNCRMCLVEVEKSPKLVASCAMPVSEGMVINTNSSKVIAARNGVLEFLLINHPLECPICDQGGECDLQDLSFKYGRNEGRFNFDKRAVKNKNISPLIRTSMTRCIHCTRCIRFATEIAGVHSLGTSGRGEHTEIIHYLEKSLNSELSGNLVDICPVGALTSKPYSFKGRSWELKSTYSIDIFDAVGSNIRVDTRGSDIMRILPNTHDDINEEWISDKTRYAFDGLRYQRLDKPYIRINGNLHEASWEEAITFASKKISDYSSNQMAALVGDLMDCESIVALKDLFLDRLGCQNLDCRQDGSQIPNQKRWSYIFNSSISGIDHSDSCLIISSNPKKEAPLINARIRKRYLRGGFHIALIGAKAELNYPYTYLGGEFKDLINFFENKSEFYSLLKSSNNPTMIIGQNIFINQDSEKIFTLLQKGAIELGVVKNNWNGFNILHTSAGRVGALDIGFTPNMKFNGLNTYKIIEGSQTGDIKLLYLLGADEIPINEIGKDTFIIYQGHHGDKGAHRADIILPGCSYMEKDAIYVNTEGRPQEALKVINPPGEAMEDWKIICKIAEKLGRLLSYSNLEGVRNRLKVINPIFNNIGLITFNRWEEIKLVEDSDFESWNSKVKVSNFSFKPYIENFYMTDVISRHSPTMAQCTLELGHE